MPGQGTKCLKKVGKLKNMLFAHFKVALKWTTGKTCYTCPCVSAIWGLTWMGRSQLGVALRGHLPRSSINAVCSIFVALSRLVNCLKKSLNVSKPSEHLPDRENTFPKVWVGS